MKILMLIIFSVIGFQAVAIEPNKSCIRISKFYESIRSDTISKFSKAERQVISSIVIKPIGQGNFASAGAYLEKTNNKRYVIFSCVHMALIGLAADAFAYSIVLADTVGQLANRELNNYLRYLVHSLNFNQRLMNYDDFLGIKLPKHLDRKFRLQAAALRYQMASAVLFHEFAHHVLNHTSSVAYASSYSRKREKNADEWAINALLKNSMSPTIAVPLFFMLNQLNERELEEELRLRHPVSIKRALEYTESSLRSFNDPVIANHIKRNSHISGLNIQQLKSMIEHQIFQFENLLAEEKMKLNHPYDYWLNKAKNGDIRGMMEVGLLHLTGAGTSEKSDYKARGYLCLAALSSKKSFDYATAAYANYLCGMAYYQIDTTEVPKDLDKARNFLNISSDMGLISARVALENLF